MSNNTYGGDSFFTLLLILFIGLKLADVIDWSWWWVMAPLWIPLSLLAVGFLGWFLWRALTEARKDSMR